MIAEMCGPAFAKTTGAQVPVDEDLVSTERRVKEAERQRLHMGEKVAPQHIDRALRNAHHQLALQEVRI